MDYHFGQFTPEHLNKMKEGIELFNEQKYWECHEALEDVWMEDRNDDARLVYWAIIQIAATCIHYRDNNLVGAQGMISKAKDKFRRCRSLNVLTNTAFKYLDWNEIERIVMEVPEADKSKLEDFKSLYNYRFPVFEAV